MDPVEALASRLRLAAGTLHVKPSADSKYDLLINKDVVKAACFALEPRLRSDHDPSYIASFDTSTKIIQPGDSQPTSIFSIAVKYVQVEETFVLEGNTFQGIATDLRFYNSFDQSGLAEEGWPETSGRRLGYRVDYTSASIARQYIALFQILHDRPLFIRELCEYGHSLKTTNDMYRYIDLVIDLCTRAEYMGCLAHIAKPVLDALFPLSIFWKDVANRPQFYILFAVKMHSTELFFDCMRHMLAQADDTRFRPLLLEYLGLSDEELKRWTEWIFEDQKRTVSGLCRDLRRLELFQTWARHWDGKNTENERTTFCNKYDHEVSSRKVRNDPDKKARAQAKAESSSAAEMIARGQWGQYFAQAEVGDRIVISRHRRSEQGGPTSQAISDIQRRAVSSNPSSLFGKCAADRIAKAMGMSESMTVQLKQQLDAVVMEADQVIKDAFEEKEGSFWDGRMRTFRRSHYDVCETYWTYMPCDETKVPWEDDQEWLLNYGRQVNVDISRATQGQLQAIGLA